MLSFQVHPRNLERDAQITLVPYVIIMVIISIITLVSMNFVIALRCFTNTRPIVLDHLLLYLWILVPLVN